MEKAKPRVLVVDDEAALLLLFRAHLEAAGFQVTTTGSSEDGLKLVRADRFDIVVLDATMPDIDGYALAGRLRQHPLTRHVAVVLVSASATDADRERARAVSAAGYIVKPFNPLDVVAQLTEILAWLALPAAERPAVDVPGSNA